MTDAQKKKVVTLEGLQEYHSQWKTGEIIYPVSSPSGTAGTSNSNRTIWTGTVSGVTALYDNLAVLIKVPVAGVNKGIVLNINNLGDHPVVLNVNSIVTTHFAVGTVLLLVYDSTQKATVMVNGTNTEITGCWKKANYDSNSNTIPSAYCETAASTAAKTASCTNYNLLSKSHLLVLIVNANTKNTALTLNVNGKGAKAIYINGSASSASNYTLPAGTYLVYYDGTNYYFRTDGKLSCNGGVALTSHQDISGKADKSATVSTVSYSSKKITKTINGSTTDVVSAATIASDANCVTSTTSGLKIEVVTSMPSSPDTNTIYIVK